MKQKIIALFIIITASIIIFADLSFAQPMKSGNEAAVECQPMYGNYGRGQKWGWYGAKREVRTPVEAKQILDNFFIQNKKARIGKIRERHYFFEAEIINHKGTLIDLIIIDKRTGRVRSIY
ncbi:MAG: hypothetical protein HXY53_06680 [Nitrospirae bacterium]|nr:hypothetical protein [Nitrospirota bacterium]